MSAAYSNPTEDLQPHTVERLASEDEGEECSYKRSEKYTGEWECKAPSKFTVDGRPYCGKHTPAIGRQAHLYHATAIKWLVIPKEKRGDA